MSTEVKELAEILINGEKVPEPAWQLRVIVSEECLSYCVWNEKTHEAILIDPKQEDRRAYETLFIALRGYRWLAIVDTHTHADHISIASVLANEFRAPLVMHEKSPSQRVQIKIATETHFSSQAGDIRFIPTPGHTQDAMSVIWGPYLFTGDTILFGDTGRDDLPGGSAENHFESIQTLKLAVAPELIVLPGHDDKGGRASSWTTQLKLNPSLSQNREDFVTASNAFNGPAPIFLKDSLRENFR